MSRLQKYLGRLTTAEYKRNVMFFIDSDQPEIVGTEKGKSTSDFLLQPRGVSFLQKVGQFAVFHIVKNHLLTCNIKRVIQKTHTYTHFGGVMKAMESGFAEINLPALIFKCLYLALLHPIT